MSDPNSRENKTPHKMQRLAWPKAKYGAIIAIIIFIIVNLTYYKNIIFSFFKYNCATIIYV